MPIRTAPRFCLGGVVGSTSYCTVVKSRHDCMCRTFGLFLTHKQCVVETGQMSSAETGQMSAAQTGQMSAVETRQMLKSHIVRLALNRQKWSEIGSEWSSGLKNTPKRILRPFPSCLLYTSPSPRDMRRSRMPSSA